MIKYQVFCFYSSGESSFNEKDLKAVLTNHRAKHNLIEEFQKSISDDFRTQFLQNILNLAQNKAPVFPEAAQNRFGALGNFLYTAYKDISLDEHETEEFMHWLKHANNLKNKGFYVDYINGNWWFPSDLTLQDYRLALKFATIIENHTSIIKDLDMSDDEFIDFMNSDVT